MVPCSVTLTNKRGNADDLETTVGKTQTVALYFYCTHTVWEFCVLIKFMINVTTLILKLSISHVPRSTSYEVYISQLIRFARASSYVADFNTSNKLLTQKLLKQGYRYHKLCKTFSKFYRRYYDLISKFQVGLKSLFRQGLSEPDFYGDLVYKLKKIVGSNNFSAHFIKIISHY